MDVYIGNAVLANICGSGVVILSTAVIIATEFFFQQLVYFRTDTNGIATISAAPQHK